MAQNVALGIIMVFLGKTYDVSPYDSQRSHPSMDLGVKWDLCVLFVQTARLLTDKSDIDYLIECGPIRVSLILVF